MRTLTVVLLVVAAVLVAIAIYWFVSIHPRRGALFVILGGLCLIGAWFSNRTARQRAIR
jgi:1,4-dihydroxy-2-naphthoate octaprenyltransferase